jgi:hypothetical protein
MSIFDSPPRLAAHTAPPPHTTENTAVIHIAFEN